MFNRSPAVPGCVVFAETEPATENPVGLPANFRHPAFYDLTSGVARRCRR